MIRVFLLAAVLTGASGTAYAQHRLPRTFPHCTPHVQKLCGHTCISIHKICHAT